MTEENTPPSKNNERQPKLYEAREAAEFLSRQWGIPYNTVALKKLRQRRGIQPYFQGEKIVLYSEDQLRSIPKPGALRKGRQKQNKKEGEDGSNTSVISEGMGVFCASSYVAIGA